MVRDQITLELWEELNRLYLFVRSPQARQVWRRKPQRIFPANQGQLAASHRHHLRHAASTTKAGGLRRPGNFIERADKTSRILDVRYETLPERGAPKTVSQTDALEWSAILRSCSAWDAYKTIHGAEVHPRLVAEFLLLNEDFPRSVRFCVGELNRALRQISGVAEGNFCNDAEKLAGRLLAELQFSTVDEIFDARPARLSRRAQGKLNDIGAALFNAYIFQPFQQSRRRNHGAAGGTAATGVRIGNRKSSIINPDVHPRRAPPQDALPIRPAGQPRPAGRAAAARAAFAHADSELLAPHHAGKTFHQLGAGPAVELRRRASFSSNPRANSCVEVDLVAEMAVLNPFDFFLEPQAEKFPFAYDPALDHELAPFQRKCWLTPISRNI